MSVTPERIELSRASIKKIVVHLISDKFGISSEEALRKFMLSSTCALLDADEAMLWVESPEYVMDMFENEMNNDMEKWLEL